MPVMPKADTVLADAPLWALPVADAEALPLVAVPVDEPVVEALHQKIITKSTGVNA